MVRGRRSRGRLGGANDDGATLPTWQSGTLLSRLPAEEGPMREIQVVVLVMALGHIGCGRPGPIRPAPRSTAECRQDAGCSVLGHCTFVTYQGLGSICSVVADEDCQRSSMCVDLGLCRAVPSTFVSPLGDCVPSPEGCRASKMCRDAGLCFAGEFSCTTDLSPYLPKRSIGP